MFKGFREEHQLQYQSTTQLQTKQEEEEECHALFGSQKVSATSIRGGGNAKNLAFPHWELEPKTTTFKHD